MKCKSCGGKTRVIATQKHENAVRRQRKCTICKVTNYTGEVWLSTLPVFPSDPKPKTIFTETEAAVIRKKTVSTRRLNEDRRQNEET